MKQYLSSGSSNSHVKVIFKLDRRYTRQTVDADRNFVHTNKTRAIMHQ